MNLLYILLLGRDLMSVFSIRESRYYRLTFFIIIKKIYENFVGTLETVRNREVSILGGSTVLYFALLSVVFKVL